MRWTVALALDVVLHASIAAGTCVYIARATTFDVNIAFVLGYVAASFLHRIAIQRITGTTAGKALVGLQLIRADTGSPPTLWLLIALWFRVLVGLLTNSP
jgi:hypothetical protein